jgi:hypothetical protein
VKCTTGMCLDLSLQCSCQTHLECSVRGETYDSSVLGDDVEGKHMIAQCWGTTLARLSRQSASCQFGCLHRLGISLGPLQRQGGGVVMGNIWRTRGTQWCCIERDGGSRF